MESIELERVRKLCKYLIYKGYGDNEKELAERLGYAKSSFSQLLNGKKPLNESFITKIESLDEKVNKGYILDESVPMLKSYTSQRVDELIYINNVQKKLIDSLEKRVKELETEVITLKNS